MRGCVVGISRRDAPGDYPRGFLVRALFFFYYYYYYYYLLTLT